MQGRNLLEYCCAKSEIPGRFQANCTWWWDHSYTQNKDDCHHSTLENRRWIGIQTNPIQTASHEMSPACQGSSSNI
jgi:hypothetical protein